MTDEGPLNNRKTQRAQRLRAEHERVQADADLKRLWGLPEFRRFMWRVQAGVCGAFSNPAVMGGVDGQRLTDQNIGKWLVGESIRVESQRVHPAAWNQMLAEAMERSMREQLSTETPPDPEPERDEP